MTEGNRGMAQPPLFQRVLLPMTMAEALRPALSFAARCAQALALPLEALFIEDEDLLALAGLPFARATSLRALEAPGLDVASVAHRLDLEARRARRILDAEAGAYTVATRFAIVRAQPQQALAAETRASDLLVLGGGLAPLWDRRIARVLALRGSAGGLLLLDERARPCRAITVPYGGQADDLALDLAACLAGGLEAAFNVIVLASGSAAAEGLRARALERLGRLTVPRFTMLAPERVGRLTDELQSSIGDLLIVPANWGRPVLEELVVAARSPRRSVLLLLRVE